MDAGPESRRVCTPEPTPRKWLASTNTVIQGEALGCDLPCLLRAATVGRREHVTSVAKGFHGAQYAQSRIFSDK